MVPGAARHEVDVGSQSADPTKFEFRRVACFEFASGLIRPVLRKRYWPLFITQMSESSLLIFEVAPFGSQLTPEKRNLLSSLLYNLAGTKSRLPSFALRNKSGKVNSGRQELFHAASGDASQVRPVNIRPAACGCLGREGGRSQIPR